MNKVIKVLKRILGYILFIPAMISAIFIIAMIWALELEAKIDDR